MHMKKIILTLALAVAAVTSVSAQEVFFGVKGGISGNWIPKTNIDVEDKVLPNIGFYGGVACSWEFNDMAFLQTELLYARKGISTKNQLLGTKYWRRLHYLELPIMFGIKAAGDRFRFAIGPQFAYCVGNKVNDETWYSYSIAENVRKFNFGIVLQPSYLVIDQLAVDLKLDWSLTNTFEDSDIGRNLCLQLGVTWWFGR